MKHQRIILATQNKGKQRELQVILEPYGFLVDTSDLWCEPYEVEETGETFVANAKLKADALWERLCKGSKRGLASDAWVLADDSGLEVDALNGAPGVHSAYYAGPKATDAENNAKLLDALQNIVSNGASPRIEASRTARFVCCLYLRSKESDEVFWGKMEGSIALELPAPDRLIGGFGYDPIFIPSPELLNWEPGLAELTLGEIGTEIKNRFSHRRGAIDELIRKKCT